MSDVAPSSGPAPGGTSAGCHKMFLGYAAGVGKTYTMLAEAQRRASRGEDIVIGYVEPHLRPDTMALVEGLELVPPKRIELPRRRRSPSSTPTRSSRGVRPRCSSTSSRTPTSPARGTRSAGSRSRRSSTPASTCSRPSTCSTSRASTTPSARSPASACARRCRTACSTRPTRSSSSTSRRTRSSTASSAARSTRPRRSTRRSATSSAEATSSRFARLALRKTAEEVDDDLEEFIATHDVDKTWGAVDRVLVAVTPRPQSAKLIRRGYQLAHRLGGDLWVDPRQAVGGAARRAGAEGGRRAARARPRSSTGDFIEVGSEDVATGHHRVRALAPDHLHRAWGSRCAAGSTRSCTARSSVASCARRATSTSSSSPRRRPVRLTGSDPAARQQRRSTHSRGRSRHLAGNLTGASAFGGRT